MRNDSLLNLSCHAFVHTKRLRKKIQNVRGLHGQHSSNILYYHSIHCIGVTNIYIHLRKVKFRLQWIDITWTHIELIRYDTIQRQSQRIWQPCWYMCNILSFNVDLESMYTNRNLTNGEWKRDFIYPEYEMKRNMWEVQTVSASSLIVA